MCSEEPIFEIKSSPCQQPWRSFCRRGCRPQQAQKKGPSCQQQSDTYGKRQLLFVHFEKWTWTFLHVNSSGRPPFTHIHTLRRGGGPYAPNSTPSPCKTVAWTSQLSSSHVLPIHRRSDSRPTWRPQANLARTSKQLLTSYGLLARASRARRPWAPFFNHSNISQACLCACAWSSIWSWSAEQPRSLCTGDAPAPHKRAAVIETVRSAFKCMPGTPGHGLTGLSAHAHKSSVIFHFFQELSNKKKIKALRPNMTKIASKGGGPALKAEK